jgi:hypothetical protein
MVFRRCLLLAVLAIAAARGARASEPTAAEKETARALMDEGNARDKRGDHKGALETFRSADALMHVPTTRVAVAKQLAALGMLVEARDIVLQVLRTPAAPDAPAAFLAAREQASTLRDELTPRIGSLRLSLTGSGNLATPRIVIDGAPVSSAVLGVPFRVNPGHHVI